jgi:hypothetical protein
MSVVLQFLPTPRTTPFFFETTDFMSVVLQFLPTIRSTESLVSEFLDCLVDK